MSLMGVAVTLIAAGLILNLILTTGLVRRLRDFSARGEPEPQLRLPVAPGLSPGDAVPEFSTTSVAGHSVSTADLNGVPWVVGFFSSGCRACREHIVDYGDYVASLRSGSTAAIAVVVGTDPGGRDLVETAQHITELLVVEDLGGAVSRSFAVEAFPSFFAVDRSGRVSHADLSARRLPQGLS